MIASNLDNLLFFLLIAVAAFFQLLSKSLSKNKKKPDEIPKSPTPKIPSPIRRRPIESDADRIRKFLEALGQPPGSTPPPPVTHRTDIPPRPLAPVQPPLAIPATWRSRREQEAKRDISRGEIPSFEQPRHVESIPQVVAAPVTSRFDVQEKALPIEIDQPAIGETAVGADITVARPITAEPDFRTDIFTLLGSKTGLREAVILHEIFGPPRGLEAFDYL
jgi:hypothetical protein